MHYLPAEETQHDANYNEHNGHADQNSNHGWIDVASWVAWLVQCCVRESANKRWFTWILRVAECLTLWARWPRHTRTWHEQSVSTAWKVEERSTFKWTCGSRMQNRFSDPESWSQRGAFRPSPRAHIPKLYKRRRSMSGVSNNFSTANSEIK